MENVNVKRVLVQGSVEFRVSCNDLAALVTPEQASDEDYMREWFRTETYRMIDISDSEAEYENEVPVTVSHETAEKYTGKIISDRTWYEIRAESKQIKSEEESEA